MDTPPRKPVANITPFGLRLQPDLKKRLEDAANGSARSLNAEIAARLEASFQDGGGKNYSFLQPSKDGKLEQRLKEVEARLAKLEAEK